MASRQSSHAWALVTLLPMACGGATTESEADAPPACATEIVTTGMANAGSGGPEAGPESERPGVVRVTNAAECGLAARLAESDDADGGADSPLTTECKALCCRAISCVGTLVGCSPLANDEVKCDAFGY